MGETVNKNCKHTDCIYRSKAGHEECCTYLIHAGEKRGCPISECDKYVSKHDKRIRMNSEYDFVWRTKTEKTTTE